VTAPIPPTEHPELDHVSRAADHILAMIVERSPSYAVTPEAHDTLVALVQAVVTAIALSGGAR
jgi:hypothetical protein